MQKGRSRTWQPASAEGLRMALQMELGGPSFPQPGTCPSGSQTQPRLSSPCVSDTAVAAGAEAQSREHLRARSYFSVTVKLGPGDGPSSQTQRQRSERDRVQLLLLQGRERKGLRAAHGRGQSFEGTGLRFSPGGCRSLAVACRQPVSSALWSWTRTQQRQDPEPASAGYVPGHGARATGASSPRLVIWVKEGSFQLKNQR